MKVVLKVLPLVQSGEPAWTRTQGPRLKSSTMSMITMAWSCLVFPVLLR